MKFAIYVLYVQQEEDPSHCLSLGKTEYGAETSTPRNVDQKHWAWKSFETWRRCVYVCAVCVCGVFVCVCGV